MKIKATSEERRSRIHVGRGRGKGPLSPLAKPGPAEKVAKLAGGASTSHQLKFSGPGDAVNAHADADHGTILYTARLRLIFWGKEWSSGSSPVQMGTIVGDVQSIVAGPYLDALEQYGVSGASVDRIIFLTDEDPPNPFSSGDGETRVADLIGNGTVPQPDDEIVPALYVIFLPSTVAGKTLGLPTGINGEHTRLLSIDWDHFVVNSVPVAWIGNDGTVDTITQVFSHELVEALTDPEGDGWQVEPRGRFDWNEIADVCASTFRLNGVVVASYWSNSDNSCVVPDTSFTTFQVQWIWRPNRIEWLGGIDQDGNPWQMPRDAVMSRIRSGDQFTVHGGTSGRNSFVGIYYLDATHPYLATNMDGAADDNLLALPQRAPT
jgi:hypothetical protein